jgi:enoyl-CoA hydratase/carnithine racemase
MSALSPESRAGLCDGACLHQRSAALAQVVGRRQRLFLARRNCALRRLGSIAVKTDGYSALRVRVDRGIAYATIDHPPINLLDATLIVELDRFGRDAESNEDVRVVVVDSADSEFFIAHADVGLILQLPREPQPRPTEPSVFQTMVDRFRTMPKATIAIIEGRARGGGSEFVLSMDMRFAARGRAMLSQPEVALGIIPGGSGTQRLPRLVGRARALEIVLGANDIDADTAERWGYVNRSLPDDELRPYVEALARRIASFPAHAIAHAKGAIAAAEPDPAQGLIDEAHRFNQTLGAPGTATRMERFLELGGQTRDFELDLALNPDDLA